MAQLKNLIVNGPSKFLGPIGGATFNKPVNFTGEEALPSKNLQFILGIDSFADGGQMGWQNVSDIVPKEAESVAWANITGKPSTFAPSAHNQDWSTITGKPTSFTPSTHGHAWSEITGKPSTFYTLPQATSSVLGGVKIGYAESGKNYPVELNASGQMYVNVPWTDTDTNTHYASKNVVGSSTATTNTTSALTNGNVYLNSVENGAVTSTHKISGSGATTVTTDASGNIIITSTDTNTDTNTTYSAGTGLTLSGTTFSANAATSSTAGITIVYPAASCTTYTSDSGTCTPAAVKKAVALFGDTYYSKLGHTHNYAGSSSASGTAYTSAALVGTQAGANGVPISGNSAGYITYAYNINTGTTGNMPNVSNNANGVITINTHSGNYNHQLGFNNAGQMYYRAGSGSALTTSTAWDRVLTKIYGDSLYSGVGHTHSTIEINGIADTTTYGTKLGVVQNSTTGPQSGTWHNSIKILHNNSAGYYTQIAQNFTGTEGLWHRRMINGTVSSWRHVLDSVNYGDYAVTLTTAQTISGVKTFTGGAKVSGRYAGGGDDEGLVIGRASNDYAGLICGEPSGVRSVFYLLPSSNGNNAAVWRFNNGTASYDIKHPCKAGTIMLTSDTLAWDSITGKPSTYTPSSHTHNYITYTDTRAENTTPDNSLPGLSVHLKTNSADGLSDGGTYHVNTTFKSWGDYSGGPYGQLAFTANQNAWVRTSTSGTAWGSWYRLLKSSGISTVTTISLSSYNALTTKDANTMYLITS